MLALEAQFSFRRRLRSISYTGNWLINPYRVSLISGFVIVDFTLRFEASSAAVRIYENLGFSICICISLYICVLKQALWSS